MIGFWRAMERSTNEKSLAWLYFVIIRLDSLMLSILDIILKIRAKKDLKGIDIFIGENFILWICFLVVLTLAKNLYIWV